MPNAGANKKKEREKRVRYQSHFLNEQATEKKDKNINKTNLFVLPATFRICTNCKNKQHKCKNLIFFLRLCVLHFNNNCLYEKSD